MNDDPYNNQQLNSFLRHEGLSSSSVDLRKKRKWQCDLEQTLQLSKYKFRDRLKGSSHATARNPNNLKNSLKEIAAQAIRDDSGGESDESSNSESEGQDTTMTLDLDDEDETSAESFPKDLPTTSSSTSTKNSIVGNTIDYCHTVNGRGTSKRIIEDSEDDIQTDKRYKGNEDYAGSFETCGGYYVEFPETDFGQLDGEIEDALLYSNGVGPSFFLDSNGKCNLDEDNRERPKKPTIDQEFEQYFSMLML